MFAMFRKTITLAYHWPTHVQRNLTPVTSVYRSSFGRFKCDEIQRKLFQPCKLHVKLGIAK